MATNDKKVQAYLSPDLYKSVELYAAHHQVSVSKAAVDLIVQGLSGFSIGDGSTQPLHFPSQSVDSCLQPVDTSQFVTRDEIESRFAAIINLLGYTEGQIKARADQMAQMSRLIESKTKNKLISDNGLTSKRAEEVLSESKLDLDNFLYEETELDPTAHPDILLARAKAKAKTASEIRTKISSLTSPQQSSSP